MISVLEVELEGRKWLACESTHLLIWRFWAGTHSCHLCCRRWKMISRQIPELWQWVRAMTGRPAVIKVLVDERETLWQAASRLLGELNDNGAYYSNETPIRIFVDHAHSVYRMESPRAYPAAQPLGEA